jgi:hypothetical protein
VGETAVPEVLARIAHEDLALPAQMPQPVDDGLRGVIQRALAREPAARYADAGELRRALLSWLTPSASEGEAAEQAGAPRAGALDFLLRRIAAQERHPGAVRFGRAHPARRRLGARESRHAGRRNPEGRGAHATSCCAWSTPRTTRMPAAGSISTVSRAVALMASPACATWRSRWCWSST